MEKRDGKIIIPGGFYLTADGPEGCGKTTQMRRLYERLLEEGYDVLLTKEPGDTDVGDRVRSILISKDLDIPNLTELFLFEAARVNLKIKKIIPALTEGKVVISDRSGFSSEAYQGYAGNLPLELVRQLNYLANLGIEADISLFIDTDAKSGLEREVDKNRFNAKGIDYHKLVRNGFLQIASENTEKRKVVHFRHGDIEGMHQEIYTLTKQAIEQKLSQNQ